MSTDVSSSAANFEARHSKAYERRWWVMLVLSVALFMTVVDNLIVNVALPTLQHQLNASTTSLQWIVDAYSLVFAGLLLVGGGLGDRFGRKGALQLGLVLFVLCSAIASHSTTTHSLIFWRGAMGVGAALVFPATLAIITNLFIDPIERAKAIGLWSAVSGMAVAFGPIAGGFLLRHFWWGSVFLINVPVGLVAVIAGAFLIPTSKDPNAHRIDKVGFLLSTATVGLLVYTVIESPHWGWRSIDSLGRFGIVAVLLSAFVWWESRHDEPLLDVTVFTNARFSAGAASIFVAFFCLFGFTFLVTQYFQFVRGYNTLSAGVHTLPFAIGAGVTAPFAARLALKFGTKRIVALGLVNMAIGLSIMSRQDAHAPYFGWVIVSMVIMANGLSFVTSPSTEAIMGSISREKAGVGSAMNDTSREVGGTLGVAVSGSIFVSLYGPSIARSFSNIPHLVENLPAGLFNKAQESVYAAYAIADSPKVPDAVRPALHAAVNNSFLTGFHRSSLVMACMALAGAVMAWKFLPARAKEHTSNLGG